MTGESDPGRTGLALALAAAAAFGTNIVSAQIAGLAGLSGPLLVFYRVAIMILLVLGAALMGRGSLAVARPQHGALLLFGLSTAGVGVAYLSSVAFVPVSVAAVLFFTYPVLIVLAEPLLTREPFRLDRLALALSAFIGVALVVGPDLHRLDPRGLALALLASVSAATQFFVAAALARTPMLPKLFWSHVVVLPVALAILGVTGGLLPPAALLMAPGAVLVTIGGYLAGFLFQVMALSRISPSRAGIAFCAEPVFAILIAGFWLGERMGPLQYAGCALVVATLMTNVILEQYRRRPQPA